MLLSMLLCLSLIVPMGITAFAESEYIAYIGDNGYTTLEEAVTAATDGDTITLAGNDLSKQQLITISKDLVIELNGYTLAGTHFNITDGNVVIRDQTGDGEINSNREIGFQSVFNPYVYATIYVAGGNLTIEGVTITGGFSPARAYLNKAVIIDGGNVIVNSGTLTGGMSNNSGGDAIYVHGGFLSINGGTFVGGTGGGCGLSMDSSVDPLNITIKKGTFKGGRTDAAIYNATTQEKVEELFIREDIGNYIEGDFQRSLVVFNYADPTVKYSVVAEAGEGGTVSGGGEVIEGGSVTLTASANEGYTFDGWYEGDIKVCDTTEFVVENVTADKTYTAKFAEDQPEPVEPSDFDFTSLRTLRTQDITVNHETKTIDINAEADTDYITVFVHQLDVIPGGTFKMASYMGNKVVYDSAGSYRIYFLSSPTVSVLANITIGEQTEQYTVNVHFDMSKAAFDFTSLRGENLAEIAVDHETKTIDIRATDDAETIILYVSQHDAIYGGTLRMASYLGNKVTYAANGVYTIYSNGKENVSVKTNITINGMTEQYLINITFPAAAPDFSFSTLVGSGIKSVAVDHEARTIVLDAADDAIAITLPIDQSSAIANGTLRMASYMGNKVVLDAETRIYTIYLRDASTINVKVNITSGGETREYLVTVNFPNIEWGFDTVKAEQVKNVTVDHERQVIDMEVEEGYDNILLYIDQTANAGLPGQIWMKSYNGNDVVYHSDDRTYTISKEDKNSITVAVKITILGETRYYDMNINFASSGE